MNENDHIIIFASRALFNEDFVEPGARVREDAVGMLTQRALDEIYGHLQSMGASITGNTAIVLDIRVTVIVPKKP